MTGPQAPFASDTYELLIQAVVDYGIYMLDPDGRVVSWNPGAQRIKGYAAKEIIGQHFSRFYTDEARAAGAPEEALRVAAETGRFSTEAWRVRKDGSRFWAMVVIDSIRDDGKLVGFAKITRDMTEHRAAQLRALESERRFRLLVQGVTDYAIYMLSPDGHVTSWNAGAERIKGYAASEIVGQHFSRFYTSEDVDAGMPEKALAMAHREGRYEAEGWRCRKDGSRFWANVVVDAIHDDDGKLVGFAKITRDLTERRETQRQLEQSREQLFQSQKMEAVGQLTGGLAHDFNNLLAIIIGNLDMLHELRAGDAATDELVRDALESALRGADLTRRLLAFARRQPLQPERVDINEVIGAIVKLLTRTLGENITIEMSLSANVWPVQIDRGQFEAVIANLATNARDAMPRGGALLIDTRNGRLDAAYAAAHTDVTPGDYVVVEVSDSGTGMPSEILLRIFEPFFTTKEQGKGTGLGLSMVFGFMKQSGGHVAVYSEPGKGTTFRLYLPRMQETAAVQADPLEAPASRGGSETILVVEDNAALRRVMVRQLGEAGYRVLEAPDADAAMTIIESPEPIDLLLTDVVMPGAMDGRELTRAAVALRPALRALLTSGFPDARWGGAASRSGSRLLSKPFRKEELRCAVREMLDEPRLGVAQSA